MSALLDSLVELIRRSSAEIPDDVNAALVRSLESEKKGTIAESALKIIEQNIELAKRKSQPLCQDTGSVLFYVDCPVGFDQITGGIKFQRDVYVVGLFDITTNDGLIGFMRGSLRKQLAQLAGRRGGQCKKQHTAGPRIQAVHRVHVLLHHTTGMVQTDFIARNTMLWVFVRVYMKAAGFVDGDKIFVLVQ